MEPEPLFDLEPAGVAGPDFAELARLPFSELMAPDWAEALAGVEAELRSVLSFLDGEEAAGHLVLPSASNVLRAFRQPLNRVRVLILGQDPYPTPGHAVGLAFSVDAGTRPTTELVAAKIISVRRPAVRRSAARMKSGIAIRVK